MAPLVLGVVLVAAEVPSDGVGLVVALLPVECELLLLLELDDVESEGVESEGHELYSAPPYTSQLYTCAIYVVDGMSRIIVLPCSFSVIGIGYKYNNIV